MKPLLKNSPYNEITEEEWQQYFTFINTGKISDKNAASMRQLIMNVAHNVPYARVLIRDKIKNKEIINITLTQDDIKELAQIDADGLTKGYEKQITFLPQIFNEKGGTIYHEILHTDQTAKKFWPTYQTREQMQKLNKLNEAEAAAVNYLIDHDLPLFQRLMNKNREKLSQTLTDKDIPYADSLTEEEKAKARELYIEGEASRRTIGQSIFILMQPEGAETVNAVAQYGETLTYKDLSSISEWKSFYNSYGMKFAEASFSEADIGVSEYQKQAEQNVKNYMTERYPELKGKNFFITGLTENEKLKYDTDSFEEHTHGDKTILGANKKPIYTYLHNPQNPAEAEEIYYDKNGKIIQVNPYKNNVLNGTQKSFEIDEKTHQPALLYEVEYKDGKKTSSILYDSQKGYVIERIDYNTISEKLNPNRSLNAYTCQQYNKNGKLISLCHFVDGREVGESFYIKNGIRSDLRYDKNGSFIFGKDTDLKTNTVRKTTEKNIINPSYAVQTLFNEQGEITARGNIDIESGNPVGRWNVKNKVIYYSGSKKGKFGEEIENPVKTLTDSGYHLADSPNINREKPAESATTAALPDEAHYIRKGQNNTTDHVYLDPSTGLVSSYGTTDKENKKIGEWTILYPDQSVKELTTYENNKAVKGVRYAFAGQVKERWFLNKDNTVNLNTYWEDSAETLKAKYVYKNIDDKNPVSSTEYYASGQLKSYSDQNTYTLKNEEGFVLSNYKKKGDITVNTEYFWDNDSSHPKSKSLTVRNHTYETVYRRDGTLVCQRTYNKEGDGFETFFTPDGNLRACGTIKNMKKNGTWTYFTDNTEQQCVYENGKRVKSASKTENNSEKTDENIPHKPSLKKQLLKAGMLLYPKSTEEDMQTLPVSGGKSKD